MKFLAILKDSVREALDYKVIYFLFGLSALVILIVGSVGYKPQEGEKGWKEAFDRMPGRRPPTMETIEMPRMDYEVEEFKHLNPTQPVWEGVFDFTLAIRGFGPRFVEEPAARADDNGKDKDKDKEELVMRGTRSTSGSSTSRCAASRTNAPTKTSRCC